MPKPNKQHQAHATAGSSHRWRNELRNQGIKVQAYTVAVAGLGCLGILEEREKIERKSLSLSDAQSPLWKQSWQQTFELGGQSALLQMIQAQRDAIDTCPYSTASLRAQVLDFFSTWDEHTPIALAAKCILDYWSAEPESSFTSSFRLHWTELSLVLEFDRDAGNYECQEEFRWVLQQLAQITAGQRALLIQGTGVVFLLELIDSLKKRGLEDCLQVDCQNTPEELFAIATLLSYGVEQPKVRFAEIEDAPSSEAYDWIISLPRFGVRSEVPDWCPVADGSDRGESFTLQRAGLSLAPGGMCLALMPRSFCSAKTSKVRNWLTSYFSLDGVIELPSRAAYSGLGIATSLLCFSKRPPKRKVFVLGEPLYTSRLVEPGISLRPDAHQQIILAPVLSQLGLNVDTTKLERKLEFTSRHEFSSIACKTESKTLLSMTGHGENDDTKEPLDGTGFATLEPTSPILGPIYDGLQKAIEVCERQNLPIDLVPLSQIGLILRGRPIRMSHTYELADVALQRATESGRAGFGAMIAASDLWETFSPLDKLIPSRFLDTASCLRNGEGLELESGDVLVAARRNGAFGFEVGVFDDLSLGVRKIIGKDGSVLINESVFVVRVKNPVQAQRVALLLRLPELQSRLHSYAKQLTSVVQLKSQVLGEIVLPMPREDAAWDDLACWHAASGCWTASFGYFSELSTLAAVLPLLGTLNGGESLFPVSSLSLFDRAPAVRNLVEYGRNQRRPEGQDECDVASIGNCLEAVRAWLKAKPGDFADDFELEPEAQFQEWWKQFLPALENLAEILQELQGLSKYLGVKTWLTTAIRLYDSVPFAHPDDVHAYENKDEATTARMAALSLVLAVCRIANEQCEAILDNVSTRNTVESATIVGDSLIIVVVRFQNASALPLLGVIAEVGGTIAGPIALDANTSLDIPFEFTASDTSNQAFSLNWQAKRIDGSEVSGTSDLSVAFTEEGRSHQLVSFGDNPYVDARTLQGSEERVFFGREKEVARMQAELAKPSAATVLLVEGNRRVGKTSLLYHFTRHHLPTGWIAAECSFQSGEGEDACPGQVVRRGIPTREVFYTLAKSIVDAVVSSGIRLELDGLGVLEAEWPPRKILRESTKLLYPYFQTGPAYGNLCAVLDQCLDTIGDRKLLLVLDEFDRLQEGIDSGVTSDQVPENIRHLFQTYNQVAGILTGSRKIRRLREQYWNVVFGIGDPLILRGLEPQAVRDLITKPVEGRLTYTQDAVQRIVHITAGQPRIVQTICSRLFSECARSGQRIITEAMVDDVAAEKAKDYEHFKVLWSAVERPTHQFVGLLINTMVRRGDSMITFDLISDEAASQGLDFPEQALELALADLTDLEITSERIQKSTKIYGIEIPMMSAWLDQNADISKTRSAASQTLNL
jgi:hypothetical protein